MAITEVRIDDRLIHGQVSTLWVPNLQIERLLIIDDKVAIDEDRKNVLKFATPPQCKLSVFDAIKAAEKLSRNIDAGTKVMIVCASPEPLVTMSNLGYTVPRITVGNLSRREHTQVLAQTAYVTKPELEAFATLVSQGAEVAFQPTPTSHRENLAVEIQKLQEGR
ncbi:PTS system mannose/fructose/N-acetylgalactosamine-transporter subunit IIB [Leucobacter sp. USHLN154]|uniref:PTS system mannose/fructose/N-acetylgalactosamine-transporter subunit IIB n=1 Tax=Leucobacter sp. USHLN154 TaxID=3081269 RepID=UPI0030184165